MKTTTYLLPAYLASYLINGDSDSITPDEKQKIDAWMKVNQLGACLDCSESAWYSSGNDGPDSNLTGDVMDFTFPDLG